MSSKIDALEYLKDAADDLISARIWIKDMELVSDNKDLSYDLSQIMFLLQKLRVKISDSKL